MAILGSRTTVMSDMSKGQLRIVACHLGTWQIGSSQETSLKLQEHQVLQLQGVCANYTKTKLIQRQTQTANFPLYNFLRLQVTSSAEMTGIFSGQSFKMVVETSGTSGKCIPCGVIAFVKQLEWIEKNGNLGRQQKPVTIDLFPSQHTSLPVVLRPIGKTSMPQNVCKNFTVCCKSFTASDILMGTIVAIACSDGST